jgi:hypothetical protein
VWCAVAFVVVMSLCFFEDDEDIAVSVTWDCCTEMLMHLPYARVQDDVALTI